MVRAAAVTLAGLSAVALAGISVDNPTMITIEHSSIRTTLVNMVQLSPDLWLACQSCTFRDALRFYVFFTHRTRDKVALLQKGVEVA